MATREEIDQVFRRLEQIKPSFLFKRADEVQAGIGAVLKLLYESSQPVTAGNISDELNVSTARVAVLIRKMAAKGLVTKEHGLLDARVTYVKLTELGEKTICEMREDLDQVLGSVIDAVGLERLQEFLDIADEIGKAVRPPRKHF